MNQSKKHSYRSLMALCLGLGLSLFSTMPKAEAAKEVALVSGAFRRSISVSDLEYLAKTGKARGLLKDALKFSRQNPETVSKLLNKKLELPIGLTSRLMTTRIGNVIINRISKIIYPLNVPNPSVSVPAFRAGVINGMQIGKGGLNAIHFLKAYPNETMTVNLPALFGIMQKAESIAGLVKFFSDSPLDGLKESKP
ncbi:MAG: alpha/beta hydrolase [Prochlorococcus sp. ALOHA_A2.0_51]|nr:alpha/beta hydrolase [Prochlorococcus sp. ALOHA_A2.0_51]